MPSSRDGMLLVFLGSRLRAVFGTHLANGAPMTFQLDLSSEPSSKHGRMVICPECQQPNSPKARFCAGCGRAIQSGDSATVSRATETAPDPMPSAQMRPPPEPQKPASEPEPKREPVPVKPLADPAVGLAPFVASARTGSVAEPMPTSAGNTGSDVRSLVREAVADIQDAAVLDTPVTVAVNFNRVLVAGHCSTAVARVENRTGQTIRDTELLFQLKGLKEDARLFIKKLGPMQVLTSMIELEPQKSGNFIFRCTLNCDNGEKKISLRGTRGIVVNAEPQAGNISVNIGDILANNDKNAGLASEVKISNLVDVSKIRTINDLLGMSLPEVFAPIPLEVDYEISVKDERRRDEVTQTGTGIPKQFLGCIQAASKLILEAKAGAMREGGKVPGVQLVARDEFRIGRERGASDYVAWFWPRSSANDERTKSISRLHMKLIRRGARILMFDNDSAHGASFEGHRLPVLPDPAGRGSAPLSADVELSARGTIVLGHEYQIDASPFDTGLASGPQIRNESLWPGPPKRIAERPGSVRFMPLNTELAQHLAMWIFTDITFGTSRMNPLILELPGLAEVAGRILHYRDHFWIESFHSEGTIAVNGYELRPGELIPLVDAHEVRLGTTEFRATLEPLLTGIGK